MFRSLKVDGVTKLYLNEPGNDLWIREIVFPNRRDGYFVEAGAADGVSDSSCYLLERQLGWRGICVEPNDYFFHKLGVIRPRSIKENVCLANESGWVDFAVGNEGMASPYHSGVRRALLNTKWDGGQTLATASIERKRASTLADLLRKHGAPREIEYGAFDIEGSEFEALRSFPFSEYRFLALSLEVDAGIGEQLASLLGRNGYRETVNPFNRHCPWERYWLHKSIGAA
jgi:hypothetical protein